MPPEENTMNDWPPAHAAADDGSPDFAVGRPGPGFPHHHPGPGGMPFPPPVPPGPPPPPPPHGFFGPGPMGPGPKVKKGDVRAAALALLAEGPRNGYQIIQEIAE